MGLFYTAISANMPIDMEKVNLFVLAVASVLIAGCRDDDYLYVRDDGIFTQSVLNFGSGGGEVTVQAETGFSGFSVSYSNSSYYYITGR